MHSHFAVVFDACVFYPVLIRDVLMQLATTSLFRARWTEEIHREWIENLAANRPDIPRDKLNKLRELIDGAVLDCLVTGYEPLVDGLTLPDPKDRHVLAAAIRCNAAVIVTTNLRHFPDGALRPLGVTAQHPDEFIMHLIDLDPGAVCHAIKTVRERLINPAFTPQELLDLFRKRGLVQTATRLSDYLEVI